MVLGSVGIVHGTTHLILQDNVTDNLMDSYVDSQSPNSNYGTDIYLVTANHVSVTFDRFYLVFNLSKIYSSYSILDATLHVYKLAETASVDAMSGVFSVKKITFNETNLTWNNQPCGTTFMDAVNCNLTAEDNVALKHTELPKWLTYNVRDMVTQSIQNNITGMVILTEIPYADDKTDYFYSKDYNGDPTLRPYLNITYVPLPTINYVKFDNTSYENSISKFDLSLNYNPSEISDISATLYYNNSPYATAKTVNPTNFLFSTSLTVPIVPSSYTNLSFYWMYTVTFTDSTSASFSTNTYNQSVIKALLDNCSVYGNVAFNFTIKDEQTQNIIQGDMDISILLNSNNYSFSFKNGSSYSLCIQSMLPYTANAIIQYNGSGYPQRNYYLDNVILSNTTQYVDLYLLQSIYAYVTRISVLDDSNNPITDMIIKVQRYYPASNSYLTVAMAKSDNTGIGITRLQPIDATYIFLVESGGYTLKQYPPTQLIPDAYSILNKILRLSTSSFSNFLNWQNKVNYLCLYNDTTDILRCTLTDTTGSMIGSHLRVWQQGPLNYISICDTRAYSSSSTLTCTIGATANGTYYYILSAFDNQGEYPVYSNTLQFNSVPIFGEFGIFLAFLIFITMVFIGAWNPVVSLVFGAVGLIFSFMMGLYIVGITQLAGIVVIIAIIIFKSRERA